MSARAARTFALALSIAGCSSAALQPTSPAGEDAGAPGSSAKPGTDASAACHDLEQKQVDTASLEIVTAPEPKPDGGDLDDGTFVLDKAVRYAQPVAEAKRDFLERVTLRLKDGTADIVSTRGVAGRETERRSRSTFTVKGAELDIRNACPAESTITWHYTSSGDRLDLFGTFLGTRMVQTFVRIE